MDRSRSSTFPSTPCSGLLISCATPATNWPRAASFSDCTRRACSTSRSASRRRGSVTSRATMTWPISVRSPLISVVTVTTIVPPSGLPVKVCVRARPAAAEERRTRGVVPGGPVAQVASSARPARPAGAERVARGAARARRAASFICTTRASVPVTMTRSTRESKLSCSSRCCRTTSSSSCMFSIAADRWRATRCVSSRTCSGGQLPRCRVLEHQRAERPAPAAQRRDDRAVVREGGADRAIAGQAEGRRFDGIVSGTRAVIQGSRRSARPATDRGPGDHAARWTPGWRRSGRRPPPPSAPGPRPSSPAPPPGGKKPGRRPRAAAGNCAAAAARGAAASWGRLSWNWRRGTPHSKMMRPKGKPTADCATQVGV